MAARTGPVIVGYDGTPASRRAVCEAGALLKGREAVVVTVWEPGRGFELAAMPALPPAPIDVRAAIELEQTFSELAQQLAAQGAELARQAGFDAAPLVVADDRSVADTLVRMAEEGDSPAVVVGAHRHRAITELVLGSTARSVVRRAPCPVVLTAERE